MILKERLVLECTADYLIQCIKEQFGRDSLCCIDGNVNSYMLLNGSSVGPDIEFMLEEKNSNPYVSCLVYDNDCVKSGINTGQVYRTEMIINYSGEKRISDLLEKLGKIDKEFKGQESNS